MSDYTKSGKPLDGARNISKVIRDEFILIETAVNSKGNQAVLDLKSTIASPTFTGIPAAPTAAPGTNTTQLATTAFVTAQAFSTVLPSQTGNNGKFVITDGSAASWASVAGASLTYLSTVTASASATVDIETTFDSTYDEYMILATGVVAATDATVLILRMKIGGSYLATATYSYHVSTPNSSASGYNGLGLDAQTEVSLTQNNSNASDEPVNLCIRVHNPSSTTTKKTIDWQGSNFHAVAPTFTSITGAAVNTGTAALTGIRILSTSGNITSGSFRLYGIKKS